MEQVELPSEEAEASMEDVAKAYMEVRQRKDGPSAAPLDAKIAAMLPKVSVFNFCFVLFQNLFGSKFLVAFGKWL